MKVVLTESQLRSVIKKSLMEAIPRDDNYNQSMNWMRHVISMTENPDYVAEEWYENNVSDPNIPKEIIIEAFKAGMDYARNN